MFEPFSHYVSYGATDQETIRELAGAIDGLVVPGTVAAFQKQGTGGFVSTLSATAVSPKYVIDPRFPLFQQPLRTPKASHQALADLLGAPSLVKERQPKLADFTPQLVEAVASHWVEFNRGYPAKVSEKFDKYSKRLNEQVKLPDAQAPLAILAPYLVAESTDDGWWEISKSLYEATLAIAPESVRVVAADSAGAISQLLSDSPEGSMVVWVSGLDELEADPGSLAAYAAALNEAESQGKATFALYGGFFSVLLSSQGLRGSSHGIGFGEYRNWIELPQSGPPPARYYLPVLHRYVRPELAYGLWLIAPGVTGCHCRECEGAPPIALEYHSLMKHSVLCRAKEVEEWVGLDARAMAGRLERELAAFLAVLEDVEVSVILASQGERAAAHIPRWVAALRMASG